uniref:Uncharacterized protein n=2 Tax=Pectobacterium atrosepticum TaxID=29471 RepID=B8X8Z7_PECAT|nr:hypothetical protein [Pectobacterium atrosepticum]
MSGAGVERQAMVGSLEPPAKDMSTDLIVLKMLAAMAIPVKEVEFPLKFKRINIMSLKPGPKRIAESTGEPDKRQRDNKKTPGNTDKLKPSKSSEK